MPRGVYQGGLMRGRSRVPKEECVFVVRSKK